MPYPEHFFEQQSSLQIRDTADPVGNLKSLQAFVEDPRPFEVYDEDLSQGARVKKTLVFADAFYNKRGSRDREEVLKKLKELQDDGFRVLIQTPDGSLREYEPEYLPRGFSLPPGKFSDEVVQDLAYKQYQIPPSKLAVMDYFGVNELLHRRRILNWHDFMTSPDDFIEVLKSAGNKEIVLKIELNKDEKQFLKCMGENPQVIPLLEKVSGIQFSCDYVGSIFVNYNHILPYFPRLESIDSDFEDVYLLQIAAARADGELDNALLEDVAQCSWKAFCEKVVAARKQLKEGSETKMYSYPVYAVASHITNVKFNFSALSFPVPKKGLEIERPMFVMGERREKLGREFMPLAIKLPHASLHPQLLQGLLKEWRGLRAGVVDEQEKKVDLGVIKAKL